MRLTHHSEGSKAQGETVVGMARRALLVAVALAQIVNGHVAFQHPTDVMGVATTFQRGDGLPSSSFTLSFTLSQMQVRVSSRVLMVDYTSHGNTVQLKRFVFANCALSSRRIGSWSSPGSVRVQPRRQLGPALALVQISEMACDVWLFRMVWMALVRTKRMTKTM